MEMGWGRSTWVFALTLGLTYSHQRPSTQLVVSTAPQKYPLSSHGVNKPLQLRTPLCLRERDHTRVMCDLLGRYAVGEAPNLR